MIYRANAYAKLNLRLAITGVRPDGYHEIDTIMRSVDLADGITVEITAGDALSSSFGEQDICLKAARMYLQTIGETAAVAIGIDKFIPMQAGMGGGSTDAAAVLRIFNRHFGDRLNPAEMCALALKIGADLPFCLTGGTKICRGVGEIMTEINLPEMHYVAILPGFAVDTKAAYAKWDESKRRNGDLAQNRAYYELYRNVFEELLSDTQREAVRQIKAQLLSFGAAGACMTGSGSAVFGAFEDEAQAQNAFEKIERSGKFLMGVPKRACL
jgi:4-diphosphocytidyl-2-C-methyl-D-erythritol kinase